MLRVQIDAFCLDNSLAIQVKMNKGARNFPRALAQILFNKKSPVLLQDFGQPKLRLRLTIQSRNMLFYRLDNNLRSTLRQICGRAST